MRTLWLLGVVGLVGCANLMPIEYEKMSADQIRELVKDKSVAGLCSRVNSPYGAGVITHIVIDKGVSKNGSISVDDQCKFTFTTSEAPLR